MESHSWEDHRVDRWALSAGILLAASVLFFMCGTLRADDGACVQFRINGVRNADGVIRVALFADEESYEARDRAAALLAPAAAVGTVTGAICSLPPGRYALSVFHDENENSVLDAGKLGIPKEGYGFSQGARGRTGPPPFRKVAFELPAGGDHSEEIKLLYWF